MDETRAQCLADIIHEAYHILQAMHLWKGYGIGFFRGWMVYYIALFPKHGYRQNPFEISAYDQEFRFLDYCEKHSIPGITPKVAIGAFKNITNESSLVFNEYQFRYEGTILPLLGSLIFCVFVTLVKPIADVLVLLAGLLFERRKLIDKTQIIKRKMIAIIPQRNIYFGGNIVLLNRGYNRRNKNNFTRIFSIIGGSISRCSGK